MSFTAALATSRPIDAAGDAQHRRLAQDLSKYPAATRPEREAHADLLPPSDRPRQHQVRDVRARDQEHERDGAQENHQRRPDIGNQILVQRNDHRSPAFVVLGILLLEAARDDRHLRVRRLQIDVAAQPGDDRGVVVVADGALLIGQGQRRPQLCILGKSEPRAHDAHDGERLAAERQLCARGCSDRRRTVASRGAR